MNELEKYELVHRCTNSRELSEAIQKIFDEKGFAVTPFKASTEEIPFLIQRMRENLEPVVKGQLSIEHITPQYGIRDKAALLNMQHRQHIIHQTINRP